MWYRHPQSEPPFPIFHLLGWPSFLFSNWRHVSMAQRRLTKNDMSGFNCERNGFEQGTNQKDIKSCILNIYKSYFMGKGLKSDFDIQYAIFFNFILLLWIILKNKASSNRFFHFCHHIYFPTISNGSNRIAHSTGWLCSFFEKILIFAIFLCSSNLSREECWVLWQ